MIQPSFHPSQGNHKMNELNIFKHLPVFDGDVYFQKISASQKGLNSAFVANLSYYEMKYSIFSAEIANIISVLAKFTKNFLKKAYVRKKISPKKSSTVFFYTESKISK